LHTDEPAEIPIADGQISVGDRVRIHCQSSFYNGIEGVVYELQTASRYAIVLMPEGTEKAREGIGSNVIRSQRSAAKKKEPIPPGDPQWFPLGWLIRLGSD
jgi:hypothetical protein